MTWKEFTEKEKVAILKSLIYVSSANGEISFYSQKDLQTIAMMMDDSYALTQYERLIKNAYSIAQSEMVATITNMNIEKKDTIAYQWLKAATKGCFGMFCINDFEEEKKVIVSMAEVCKVNINNYLYTKHEFSSI